MKNLQKLSTMAMLMCLVVTLFSCSKDDEELGVEAGIVGKWEVTSSEVMINGQSVDAFVKELAEQSGMSEEDVKEYFEFNNFEDEDNEVTIEFKGDKSFVIVDSSDDDGSGNEAGIWEAGEDRTLILGYDNEDSNSKYQITYNVNSLKSDRATISLEFDEFEAEFEGTEYTIKQELFIHMKK